MEYWDKQLRSEWPQRLQKNQNRYGLILFGLFLLLDAAVLATSVVMEESRNGRELPFPWWDPFVWEYTSVLSIWLLMPVLHWSTRQPIFTWARIGRSLGYYGIAALVFSVFHVGMMVAMREAIYGLQGREYDFGNVWYEFFYELRKDVITFIILVCLSHGYRFIVSRIIGEANLVAEVETGAEETAESPVLKTGDRILVKKLGKEFIVKLQEVEWMESSGNYVNLHIKDRIYPIRKTLSALAEEIASKGFCRIHRSHAINLDCIESIEPLPSGDSEVKLRSGRVLNISRRYKDELKQRLL